MFESQPSLVSQHISAGISFKATDKIKASLAGQYALNNEIEGVWKSPMFPGGENPATMVKHELSTLTLIGGISISF